MWYRMMLICFLTNGLGAFGLRVMSGMGLSETFKFPYLTLWFWSGFLLASVVLLAQRQIPNWREILVGVGLAASSVIGQLGMSYSLDHGVPGYVVFQVAPGGGLFLVVLVGIFCFKERVSSYGIAGIVIGMAALAILTFG